MRDDSDGVGRSTGSAFSNAERTAYALVDRFGAVRLWAAVVLSIAAALLLGSLLFPRQVYAEFIWQYFWGPVYADAHGVGTTGCAAWADGARELYGNCADVPAGTGPTAAPGYTYVSYAGYIPTLILLLVGIFFLVERLEIERYRAGFYALFPFMLFGGALRTVEDASVAAPEMLFPFPWTGLIISPLIYFTVAGVAIAAVVTSVALERRGVVSGYEYPLFAIGTGALAITTGYLGYLAATEPWASFHPEIAAITLVGATLVTALAWVALERFSPATNAGTLYMGAVVIWAHAIDGIANVIGLNWAARFGSSQYNPKHPVNEAIVNLTGSVLPQSVTDVIGTAWPFLLVKVAAAVIVVRLFDESVFEESPRFTYLMLVTVVAVGLGPGTRDFLRATFGI